MIYAKDLASKINTIASLRSVLSVEGINSKAEQIELGYVSDAIVTNGGESSICERSGVLDLWVSVSGVGGYTNVNYYTSVNLDGTTFTPYAGNPVLTGVAYAQVVLINGVYYLFANKLSDSNNLHLWSSTDRVTWTELNGGNQVLSQATTGSHFNVSVFEVDGTLHMLIETTGGLSYSYSNLTDLNWNTHWTPNVVIPLGCNPCFVKVPDRNAVICFYGERTLVVTSMDVFAAVCDLDADFSDADSWIRSTSLCAYWPGMETADPSVVFPTGFTHKMYMSYNYNQSQTKMILSELGLNDFYDALLIDGLPMRTKSKMKVGNLNADLLDNQHAPEGKLVGDKDIQTLTNKTLEKPVINGEKLNLRTETGSYTIEATDYVILFDVTAGNASAILPDAVDNTGLHFIIKKIDSSTNTVRVIGKTGASQTINGTSFIYIYAQWQELNVVSDGHNWVTINSVDLSNTLTLNGSPAIKFKNGISLKNLTAGGTINLDLGNVTIRNINGEGYGISLMVGGKIGSYDMKSYADNTAAKAAGFANGVLYRITGTDQCGVTHD